MQGTFGPHCAEAEYRTETHPARVTLWGDGDQEAPFLLVLRSFDEASMMQAGVQRGASSGLVRHDADAAAPVPLGSPFAGGPVLARLEADVGGVWLDGVLLDDQQERTVSRTYQADAPDGPRRVDETLLVRNLGRIDPELRSITGPCD